MRADFLIAWLAMLALALPAAARAAESYDSCTGFITSVPAVIANKGVWCLKQNLATAMASGNAITVNTNGATIDCNHFRLDGTSAGAATTATGIYALDRNIVTVRHCAIGGFYNGVKLTGSGHLVEGNLLYRNTSTGLDIDASLATISSLVRDNQIINTGGSTVSVNVFAIQAHHSVDVIGNTVSGVFPLDGSGGNGYGVYLTGASLGASIRQNRVHDIRQDYLAGMGYGIYIDASAHVMVRGNDVANVGGSRDVGVTCSSASSVARGNVVRNFITPFSNCADGGGNFDTP
jgi:hypothetical protein